MSTIDDVIKSHLRAQPLDLRVSRNGRWIDQKLAPDLLSFVADAVLNLPGVAGGATFTKNDVWYSSYFETVMVTVFNKPKPKTPSAGSEYDKVAGQPLRLLSYAGVLSDVKVGNSYEYTLEKVEILEFVARTAVNARSFLVDYISETLKQSGFSHYLDEYFSSVATREDMDKLKRQFELFTLANTSIRTPTEIFRIFPKVINPLASWLGRPGVRDGFVTNYAFPYSDLMYNRPNWRDTGKPKGKTRAEAVTAVEPEAVRLYEMRKVMRSVNNLHSPDSELQDSWSAGEATQVHHIFPKSRFPELAAVPENLILLTPQQHNTRAHPGNNTALTDVNYQLDCLVAKIKTVTKHISGGGIVYSDEGMRRVIREGLGFDTSTLESWGDIVAALQRYRK